MSSIIGHGYFQLQNPDAESINAVKAILERPCVIGAFYIVGPIMGKDALRGFLLMDRAVTDEEHNRLYHDLGAFCKLWPLNEMRARMTMKGKGKKKFVKITRKEMMDKIDHMLPP